MSIRNKRRLGNRMNRAIPKVTMRVFASASPTATIADASKLP